MEQDEPRYSGLAFGPITKSLLKERGHRAAVEAKVVAQTVALATASRSMLALDILIDRNEARRAGVRLIEAA